MGRHSLSDDEKIKRGTFREDWSEEAIAARNAAKVVTGVFLPRVPEPGFPLNEIGRKKYDQLASLLLNQNKLTTVTCDDCERMAVMHQQMHACLESGKRVPMELIKRMDSISVRLRIAEDAPAIANPGKKNRFEGSGFSNSRTSPIRLRPYQAAGQGEH